MHKCKKHEATFKPKVIKEHLRIESVTELILNWGLSRPTDACGYINNDHHIMRIHQDNSPVPYGWYKALIPDYITGLHWFNRRYVKPIITNILA